MFLEKVQGEYQGAVFHFAAMDKSPANRFLIRPNGDVLVGGLGSFTRGHSDWNWGGGVLYGLQALRPTGVLPFDLLAVRAVQGGFDLEFTKPLGSGAENPGNYEIRTWGYISERRYDSQKQNEYGMGVNAARLSEDRKQVHLALNNPKEGNVVYIRVKESVLSQTNESPWVTEAWYTLNRLGTSAPLQPIAEPWIPSPNLPSRDAFRAGPAFEFDPSSRILKFGRPADAATTVSLRDLRGREVHTFSIRPGETGVFLSPERIPSGIYMAIIKQRKSVRGERIAVY